MQRAGMQPVLGLAQRDCSCSATSVINASACTKISRPGLSRSLLQLQQTENGVSRTHTRSSGTMHDNHEHDGKEQQELDSTWHVARLCVVDVGAATSLRLRSRETLRQVVYSR